MKQTIDMHGFRRAFEDRGRADQFSWEALEALFDYYTELETLDGEELELDVIAICCEWSEYDSAIEAYAALCLPYGGECSMDEEEALDYLCDRTTVLGMHGRSGVIVQAF